MNTQTTVKPITRGQKYKQIIVQPDGTEQVRIIKVIGRPTLSSPVGYRIIRNDAHPHRVGKTGSIRRADLERKYVAA